MKVGMADAAIKDFDLDITRARLAPLKFERSERTFGIHRRITVCFDHVHLQIIVANKAPHIFIAFDDTERLP